MQISTNMGLIVWNAGTDKFSHSQLALNLQNIDAHDHTSGKGIQIPTAGLANLAVSTAKLQDSAVTGAKIADGTIGAVELADGAVSSRKLSPTYGYSGSTSDATNLQALTTSFANLTGMSVTVAPATTQKCLFQFQCAWRCSNDGTSSAAQTSQFRARIQVDGTTVGKEYSTLTSLYTGTALISTKDMYTTGIALLPLTAGSHTITVQGIAANSAAMSASQLRGYSLSYLLLA